MANLTELYTSELQTLKTKIRAMDQFLTEKHDLCVALFTLEDNAKVYQFHNPNTGYNVSTTALCATRLKLPYNEEMVFISDIFTHKYIHTYVFEDMVYYKDMWSIYNAAILIYNKLENRPHTYELIKN